MDFSGDDYFGTTLIALKHETCIIFAIDSQGNPFDGGLAVPGLKLKKLSHGSKPLYCLIAGGRKTLQDAVDYVLEKHLEPEYSGGGRMTVADTARYIVPLWSNEDKYRQPNRRSVLVIGVYDFGQQELWATVNDVGGSQAKQIDEDVFIGGCDESVARPFFSAYNRGIDINRAIRWIEEAMVAASELKNRTGGEIKIIKILPDNGTERVRFVDVSVLKEEKDARSNQHQE